MTHRLNTIAVLGSLVLSVLAMILWIASHTALTPFGQFWETSRDGNNEHLGRGWVALSGSIYFLQDDRVASPHSASQPARSRKTGIDPIPRLRPRPVAFGVAQSEHISRWIDRGTLCHWTIVTRQISVSILLIAGLFAVLPVYFAFAEFKRWQRRVRQNCCANCGYSLTGNISGTCPECGTRHSALSTRR